MKKIVVLFISMFLFMNVNAEELASNAKSSIIIEESTGNIIYEKNSHEKLAPASVTEMMSLLLIMEAIDSNVITLDQEIVVSENASNMGGSQILLETGENFDEVIEKHFLEHEKFLNSGGQEFPDWANKYIGTVLRIAGLLQVADGFVIDKVVTVEVMERAINIGRIKRKHLFCKISINKF